MAASLSKRASQRISDGLKRFQPILEGARRRDVNEADTVTVVKDLLEAVLGYDKYAEVTSEHAIRGTYCDLAVKLDGDLAFLIEVKAIGIELKDPHVKQAVDYAANQGVEWVILTNGIVWRVYKVSFKQPIEHELVVDVDLLATSHRKASDLALIGLLSKEGWKRANLGEYASQKQALSPYNIGALLVSDGVIAMLRREIRRLSPGIKVDGEDIQRVLESEIIKREVLEGDKAQEAKRQVARSATRRIRASRKNAKRDETNGASATKEP